MTGVPLLIAFVIAIILPSFTASETVTSPNSLTQQSVRDYFFVKLCIFYCLPFCIVVV